MHFPFAGERVWVGGSPHEFVVLQADYPTRVATISPLECLAQVRRCAFHALFAHDDFEASQTLESSIQEQSEGLLASSKVCFRAARVAVREMRETVTSAQATITKSQELIAQTDRVIARWKLLGCKP